MTRRFRRGLGQEIKFRNDTGALLTAFCIAPRSEFPTRGLFGGGDGSRRTVLIDGRAVHPKGAHTVAPGQRFTMRDAGDGGFGSPANRPPAKVLADVAEGLVSPVVAREVYGGRYRFGVSRVDPARGIADDVRRDRNDSGIPPARFDTGSDACSVVINAVLSGFSTLACRRRTSKRRRSADATTVVAIPTRRPATQFPSASSGTARTVAA